MKMFLRMNVTSSKIIIYRFRWKNDELDIEEDEMSIHGEKYLDSDKFFSDEETSI